MNIKIQVDALDVMARGVVGIRRELAMFNYNIRELIEVLTPPTAVRIIFYEEVDGKLKRIGGLMFQKVTEKKKFAIKITDKFGNEAKVDGAPVWAKTDESLVDIEVSEDGMSAVVTPKGPIGSVGVQVKADADLGEGVKDLLGQVDLDLVAGDAEVIAISEVPLE